MQSFMKTLYVLGFFVTIGLVMSTCYLADLHEDYPDPPSEHGHH